jgi:hypothetical protein
MSYKHTFTQSVSTPEASFSDTVGSEATGDTVLSVDGVVNANGGAANALTVAFPATGFQSMVLWATVPCVITFTGITVIDAVTISTVTLAAGVLRRVSSITGACTAASVGVNTDSGGDAGTINISVIYSS